MNNKPYLIFIKKIYFDIPIIKTFLTKTNCIKAKEVNHGRLLDIWIDYTYYKNDNWRNLHICIPYEYIEAIAHGNDKTLMGFQN